MLPDNMPAGVSAESGRFRKLWGHFSGLERSSQHCTPLDVLTKFADESAICFYGYTNPVCIKTDMLVHICREELASGLGPAAGAGQHHDYHNHRHSFGSVVAVFCLDADQDSYLMKRGGLTLHPCKLVGNCPSLLNSVTVLHLLGQAQNF